MNEAKLGLRSWDMCDYEQKLERLRSTLKDLLSKTERQDKNPERPYQDQAREARIVEMERSRLSSMLD